MKNILLPAGLYDLLAPDAGVQEKILHDIMQFYQSYGYEMVDPPFAEFEESLFSGTKKSAKTNSFRFIDPISHNMMAIRPDITMQIARIASSRFSKNKMPLRLSYAGQVLRAKSDNLRGTRQLTQAGIELIGADNSHADAQVIKIAVKALQHIGIKGICVDFTMPGLTALLIEKLGLSKANAEKLTYALNKKDNETISAITGKHAELFMQLTKPGITIASLKKLDLPAGGKELCARLADIISLLKGLSIKISIDPLETLKFGYHTGIGFSLFAHSEKTELGRGGNYIIDNDIKSVGFTLYMNELFSIIKKPKPAERVYIPVGADTKTAEQLQAKGMITVYAVCKDENTRKSAANNGCGYYLDGKKMVGV